MAIKNIIFDLGVVIIDVDTGRTHAAFEKLGVKNFSQLYSYQKQEHLFDDFEKGYVTDVKFRNSIRDLTQLNLSDAEIDFAWNAMVGEVSQQRFNFLNDLKNKYNIFLCSNTNIIHWRTFSKYFDDKFGTGNFEKLFQAVYYSFECGMRKPDPDFYELMIEENNLIREETLLVDDNEKNIESACAINLKTWLLKPKEKIEDQLIEKTAMF